MQENPLRHQLLSLQRKNYTAKLKLAQTSFTDPPYVKKYGREYLSDLRAYQKVATRAELLRKALSVDVVYHGDYHTLRHSQRAILAMLQALSPKRPLVLAMEIFHAENQGLIDRFQKGDLGESEFLRRIRYAERWAYNFNPWRTILQFCRDQGIPVLGINSDPPPGPFALKSRDKASAKIIARALIRHAPALIYVVDGDYHIAPSHLPKEVDRLLAPIGIQPKKLILYQNVENLYWKMARAGEEEAQILKIGEDRYCLMNTVPATKLQSYLDWLEYAEDGYSPVRGEWAELWGDNYLAHIQALVRDLADFLQLQIPKQALARLSVFSSRNLDFAERVKENPVLTGYWPLIHAKLRREEGFLLEYKDKEQIRYWIYLPNASVNQAAEEAAHFVHAVMRGPFQIPKAPLDAFYQTVMTEALGFFGSKLFNERRKGPTEAGLRRLLGRLKQGELKMNDDDALLMRSLLQHLHLERRSPAYPDILKKFPWLAKSHHPLAGRFATQLGYILGSRCYYASKRGQLDLRQIRDLFHRGFSAPGEAYEAYLAWTLNPHLSHAAAKAAT